MMRRTLILLLSVTTFSTEALSQRPVQLDVLDGCATVDCASGLVCGMAIPQSCNVAPCPKMPTCLPKNQTCGANSCKADETCVLRSVTCVMAPCYPMRQCVNFPKCGDNEEYNECSLNGPCEANCTDSFPICANVTCGKGACECKPGFFRHNGKCITKDMCPTPKCEMPNEVWNTCPSACTQTCRIFRGKDEQMPCPAVCDTPQCTCAVGYVRDDDWNCVKQEDCPKEFKCSSPHEEYTECSSHCEPTCDNRMPSCIESCGPSKCQCKPDYVRHEGSCLFALQCPQEGNSTMGPIPADDDVSGSEESSAENSNEKESSPSCDTIRCGGNTACSIQGGKPICSKCGKNEKVDPCPNVCSESTCEDGNEKRMCMAVKMCRQQKCICDDGFVRNTKNGKCVKKNECPAVDNSTVHILPHNWTKPLIRPAFPDNNGTEEGQIHILPFPLHDGSVHIIPVAENGSILSDPIPTNRTRPFIKPFFPSNETMHINPHFGNTTIQISPPYVGPLVRPAFPDRNGTILVDPIPSNWTRPLIRPFFPDNNGSFDGSAHILPFIPRDHGTVHASSTENGTVNIMPHIGKNDLLTDPIPSNWTRPMIRPAFPDNNRTMHILPFIPRDDAAVHIMPIFENGTSLVDPIFNNRTRPQTRPFFPDNGTMHIMPHHNDNGTMISVPYVPSFNGSTDGTISILPFFPGNASVHVRPIFTNRTRPQVMPLYPGDGNRTMHILPFIPNEGAVHIMPMAENGTMHILPHILPFPENTSSSIVCANHTCPTGSWCEETPVMCFAAPCPPIPTCVSVTPRGGGARDDPIICGKNEEYSECAPPCEETCRGVNDCADKVMAAVCKPGCVCKDKFKRDGNGVCVPNHKCWKTAGCQDNEIWHKCRTCEPTCTDAKELIIMSDGSVAVERKEQSDQNLEDEIEEEDEPELAIIEMEEQCDKEEGIHNENDVYSSLEDANRVRIEAPPHTFVGRSRYSDKGLMLWNELQEKIKNDSDSVETQGTVHYYQTLLKIVQYTEDIKRSAEVIFDNITSITEFHNDDKAQAIFKYSKKSFQRQADRLCAFYNLPKERNSLSGEIELGGEEEIKEEGSMEMEVGLIEEEEEEEVKEEDNEQDNTLIQSNHSASVIETTDHNNVPSSSTSSISVVLNTPSHMDDITNTTQSLPQQSALLNALTSPSHLPSNESSPSLHNSRPPSDLIPSSIPNQSIIAVTSPLPHSPLNSVAGPSTPLDTHLSPSRIELSSSSVPPSSITPSSSQLPGSPPLKRVRVETDSSHSIKSTAPSQCRPVQIRISPAKVSTPSSVGHPNTPATSRHPQSMPFPSDYAQNSAWFQQMMMSQGMSQFPPMSPHQMMHFHPGMKMQRKIGVPNQMPHQQTRASAPHISSQPGPSTQTNTTLSGPPSSQSTPPPIQKQMQNEMIQRIMCGENPDSPMSPPPQVNGHQPGRQMMMIPNGQRLSMHHMQQFQQQQYYQAMMAQQMQFMQQNRPQ